MSSVAEQKNIYYDMFHVNSSNNYEAAEHNDHRDAPLIDNPSKYKLSCVRMDISIRDIPMMDTATLNLSVGVYYEPENLSANAALFAGTTLPNRLIYNVDEILNSVGGLNDTLETLFLDIIAQYEAIHGVGSWAGNPNHPSDASYVLYEQGKGFSFYSDPLNEDSNQFGVSTYFSLELCDLFLGLPYNSNKNLNGYDSPIFTLPNWMKLFVTDYPGNSNLVGGMLEMRQQFDSFASWYHFNKILLMSNNIGVRNSYYASPLANGKTVQFPIITDFLINYNSGDNSPGSILVYYPTAEYRIIDLISQTALQDINLSLKVADNKGNVIPLSLFPGDHFAIKLLFTNSNNH